MTLITNQATSGPRYSLQDKQIYQTKIIPKITSYSVNINVQILKKITTKMSSFSNPDTAATRIQTTLLQYEQCLDLP